MASPLPRPRRKRDLPVVHPQVDAERWLQDELAKLNRGLWIDPSAGQVTFAEWVDTWLPGLDIKPKTRAGHESLLRSRILPVFGAVELRRIAPAEVREWVAAMADAGLSASRIRQARQLLGAALGTAVTDGILGRNPVTGVKIPTDRPRQQRFLDANQVTDLAQPSGQPTWIPSDGESRSPKPQPRFAANWCSAHPSPTAREPS